MKTKTNAEDTRNLLLKEHALLRGQLAEQKEKCKEITEKIDKVNRDLVQCQSIEAKSDPELQGIVEDYDKALREVKDKYFQMIQRVREHWLSRADVVATFMEARNLTFETAQVQYARMKKIFNNEEILQLLEQGLNLEVTLKPDYKLARK